jgi:hypothetical protein
MSNVTLLIGVTGAALVLLLRPLWGFAVYMAVLFFYPIYIVVQLGPLDVYASRIVVTALLARCLLDRSLRRKFKWCSLDTWVMLYFGVTVFVTCMTQPPLDALQNRAGIFMDTGFAYIAMRLCITSRAAMVTVAKSIAILLVPLAFLGFLESAYNWRPYGHLRQYCPWRTATTLKPGRLGFERAEGPIGNAALFGATFAMFLPCIWALRHERGSWRTAAYVLSGAAIIGAMSSVSSGPWVMVIIIIGCLVLERFKWAVKPVIVFIILGCIAVAIISNRPIYHVVVSYLNPVGGTGWHRAKLIDVAIEHFGEWWFAGYGDKDPGWGDYLGMAFTDVTNHFILDGIRYGIWGVIADSCMLAAAIQKLRLLHKNSNDRLVKSWAWALSTAVVGTIILCMSVSLFGQPITFLYIILGMVGSSYHFTGDLEQLQYQSVPVQSNISIPPQEAMLRRSWII